MPTPWRHPKHGTYYLKKRVPLDIKHLWTKPDPYQVSLGTKNLSDANRLICKEWLKLEEEFDQLRRKAARQLGLCEEIIPDLLEEWLHQMLKEDEQLRFAERIDRVPGEPNPGFEIAVEQLDAGIASGDHPDFLIREAVWFLKGCWRDNVFVERLWRTIKYDEVYLHAYESVSQARAGIDRFLTFYNTTRPHSSLDGKTPDQAYFNLKLLEDSHLAKAAA